MRRRINSFILASLVALVTVVSSCGGNSTLKNMASSPVLVAPALGNGRVELPHRRLGNSSLGDHHVPLHRMIDSFGGLFSSRDQFLNSVKALPPLRFDNGETNALWSMSDKVHWSKEALLFVSYGGTTCVTMNVEKIFYDPATKHLSIEYSVQDEGRDMATNQRIPTCGGGCGYIDTGFAGEIAIPLVDTRTSESKLVPTSQGWIERGCRDTQ